MPIQTISPTSRQIDPLLDSNHTPLPGSPCLNAASDGTNIGAVQTARVIDPAEYDRVVAEYSQLLEQDDALQDAFVRVTAERDSAQAQLALALTTSEAEKALLTSQLNTALTSLEAMAAVVSAIGTRVEAVVTAGTIRTAEAEEMMAMARSHLDGQTQALALMNDIATALETLAKGD